MKKKLLIEFIPLVIFIISVICAFFKLMPYALLMTVVSGVFLAMIYFYAAFWLFAETGTPVVSRIVAGVAFSINIIACVYCLQRWPIWKFYGLAAYFFLAAILIICLFNYRSSAYKPLLYRSLLFLILLSAIYGYRSFSI
jgi:hypothetical protein